MESASTSEAPTVSDAGVGPNRKGAGCPHCPLGTAERQGPRGQSWAHHPLAGSWCDDSSQPLPLSPNPSRDPFLLHLLGEADCRVRSRFQGHQIFVSMNAHGTERHRYRCSSPASRQHFFAGSGAGLGRAWNLGQRHSLAVSEPSRGKCTISCYDCGSPSSEAAAKASILFVCHPNEGLRGKQRPAFLNSTGQCRP